MSNHGFFALIICTLCKLTCLHLGQHCQLPQTYKVQWLAYFLSSLSAHQVNFYEIDHCQLSSNWTAPIVTKKWSSPHCKLSCCWSQSAPCCTCTSHTSPRIGHVWTNLLGLLGFVFLQVYYNQVSFLFCSCPTMMLWPPLKGSLYIFTGCRYVSELLPSAWGKTKMMKATKRNKQNAQKRDEHWTTSTW